MLQNNGNTNRTAIFIDGSNIYHAMKNIGWDIDWKKLQKFFSKEGNLVNAFYYMVEKKPLSKECMKLQDILRKNGYKIKKKDLKKIYCKVSDSYRLKGDMDIDLTLDVIRSEDTYDTCILFTGDSDFVPLIEYLESRNKIVKVVSSIKNGTAREIKDAVGMNHISLEELRPLIEENIEIEDRPSSKVGFDNSSNNGPKIGALIKNEQFHPKVGDIIKTSVLHAKEYGVFLKNKWKLKVLLPASKLGINNFVETIDGIFNSSDQFLAQIIKVDEGPDGIECMAILKDVGMRQTIIQRLSI